MKPAILIGILLIVLGTLSLAYGGINYTRREEVIHVGPLEATVQEKKRIPLPAALGGVALAGGVALVVAGSRK